MKSTGLEFGQGLDNPATGKNNLARFLALS
jgi:hypothetical protein